jgi:hypothetical protein
MKLDSLENVKSNYQIRADAHVHIYPFMSLEDVLAAASRNLFTGSGPASTGSTVGVMVVADPEGVKGFARLRDSNVVAGAQGDWSVSAADGHSTSLSHESGMRIVAIRGQQLITREGLEVLATAHDSDLKSGLSLASMVDAIRDANGLAIIAWGVGKWLGKRGRLVSDLVLAEGGCPDIMLCDNAGRPGLWSRVSQFELAEERSMRIVAGSDPLPLRGEESRVGGFGVSFAVQSREGESVAEAFRRVITVTGEDLQYFGKRMRIGGVISNQLRLRTSRTDGSS